MITLHHTHLMALGLDTTIALWRDQPSTWPVKATVQHLGTLTDQLEDVIDCPRALGLPRDRHKPGRIPARQRLSMSRVPAERIAELMEQEAR